MYQALYRKWRPRTFDDVVGQEHITDTLKNQLASGRLSHAYLFVGTRGTGKTTCAKILAKAVNCEHPVGGNPCNRCPSCRGIDNSSILDVEELDAASNNSVDNVRMLRDEAVFTPAAVKRRVYIVDEVHMLSTAAFNALLKILEEPPEHLLFILATTEIHKVPATILSRCQRFTFRRLSQDNIRSRLQYVASQEQISLTEDGSELLSRLADGGMRDALSLLDQCRSAEHLDAAHILSALGLVGSMEIQGLYSAIQNRDIPRAMEDLDRLYYAGKDLDSLFEELLTLMRDVLMTKVLGQGAQKLLSGAHDPKFLSKAAREAHTDVLMACIQSVQEAMHDMEHTNKKVTAELALIRMCDPSVSEDASALRSRIARLEDALRSGVSVPQTAERQPEEPVDWKEPPEREEEPRWEEPRWEPAPQIKRPSEPEIAPQPQSVSVPVPQPEPVPKSVPVGAAADPRAWQEILDTVRPDLELFEHMFLSDPIHSETEIRDGSLTVGTKSPIAMNTINTPAVTTALKAAAQRVLGYPVVVKVTEYQEPTPSLQEDKLDALSRFNNIKFE